MEEKGEKEEEEEEEEGEEGGGGEGEGAMRQPCHSLPTSRSGV